MYSLIICAITLLQLSHGHVSAIQSCDFTELMQCQARIGSFSHGTSDLFAEDVDDLKRECRLQQDAIACVKNFVQRCMKSEEREIFWHTAGGKLKFIAEICADTTIRKKYIDNLECFQRIRNDSAICQQHYEASQNRIKSEIDKDRTKMFHGCCAFDWLRHCKAKAVEKHCAGDEEAVAFVDYMSNTLGGELLTKLCESTYPSCFGELYGFDKNDLNGGEQIMISLSTTMMSLVLLTGLKGVQGSPLLFS